MTRDETALPVWLGLGHRTALALACTEAVAGPAAGTDDLARLLDVLTELDVAGARDKGWPASASAVRRAAGWTDDVIAVRMSALETLTALRYVTDPALRRALDARTDRGPAPELTGKG